MTSAHMCKLFNLVSICFILVDSLGAELRLEIKDRDLVV